MGLVRGGKTPSQVAKELDLTETALREWVKRAAADSAVGNPDVLTTEERQELEREMQQPGLARRDREDVRADYPLHAGHALASAVVDMLRVMRIVEGAHAAIGDERNE